MLDSAFRVAVTSIASVGLGDGLLEAALVVDALLGLVLLAFTCRCHVCLVDNQMLVVVLGRLVLIALVGAPRTVGLDLVHENH